MKNLSESLRALWNLTTNWNASERPLLNEIAAFNFEANNK